MTQRLILRHGDCVEVLKGYDDGSIGAFCCDPPYHISFMGKSWDAEEAGIAFSADLWDEVYRVLQPGGVVKAFSGTRTFHRMAMAMAEVGLVDLRLEAWAYGSGFPKSLNVGKALDRIPVEDHRLSEFIVDVREATKAQKLTYSGLNAALGERAVAEHLLKPSASNAAWPTAGVYRKLVEVVDLGGRWDWLYAEVRGTDRPVVGTSNNGIAGGTGEHAGEVDSYGYKGSFDLTLAATEAAQRWTGWGTALKPSWEPVCVGRKPE